MSSSPVPCLTSLLLVSHPVFLVLRLCSLFPVFCPLCHVSVPCFPASAVPCLTSLFLVSRPLLFHVLRLRSLSPIICPLSQVSVPFLPSSVPCLPSSVPCLVMSKNGLDALQRKSHLCIPFLGIAQPQSQFPHSCVCERFQYSVIFPGSVHIFPAAE
jgi:hypothetical protein